MNVLDEVLYRLKSLDNQVTSEIIKDLINDHASTRKRMISLHERYKASVEGVPIFSRQVPSYEKVNNRLNNDFFSEIVDTKVGYFMGKPIVYSVDRETSNYEVVNKALQDWILVNNNDDVDSETAKYASICGLGARLMYIDSEGQERVMVVPPWECIFVFDRSIHEPQYALRYYLVTIKDGDRAEERVMVEWYDSTHVTFYLQDSSGEFVPDDTEKTNPMLHMFEGIPLLAFPNNEEMQGDAEKVLALIDSYDRTISDVNSEIESFRLAYMLFYGFQPDQETIDLARQTGAFGIPNPEDDSRIEFLTKQINDVAIENHLNRLEQNILRFAKSVNFTDEQFASNLSGVAMRFKLFNLESKCITAQRKFTASLRNQFKLLTSAWMKKGLHLSYTQIWFEFKRNFPLNLMDEAQASLTLKGLVSERTRLSQLSFIDDIEWELQEMEREALDLDGGLADEFGQESESSRQENGSTFIQDRESLDSRVQSRIEED